MVDKLLSLKSQSKPSLVLLNRRFKFSNYLVRIYFEQKSSDKWFQIMIDSLSTVTDVLLRAKREFDFSDPNRFSLFEVCDDEILLERILSVGSVVMSTLSNWRTFALVVKLNYLSDLKPDEVVNVFDSCYSIGTCQQCLRHEFNYFILF